MLLNFDDTVRLVEKYLSKYSSDSLGPFTLDEAPHGAAGITIAETDDKLQLSFKPLIWITNSIGLPKRTIHPNDTTIDLAQERYEAWAKSVRILNTEYISWPDRDDRQAYMTLYLSLPASTRTRELQLQSLNSLNRLKDSLTRAEDSIHFKKFESEVNLAIQSKTEQYAKMAQEEPQESVRPSFR